MSIYRYIHIVLAATWLFLYNRCRIHSYFDPSSFFFDPERAYDPLYSNIREIEADDFLRAASSGRNYETQSPDPSAARDRQPSTAAIESTASHASTPPLLCLGIPSLQRQGEQFLGRTIASLVDNVSRDDRQLLHMVVLLADYDPSNHSAFGQTWLENIADEILVYEHGHGSDFKALPHWKYRQLSWENGESIDSDRNRTEHMRRDDTAVMEACDRTGADYFILVEDDTIAAQDWFPRVCKALAQIDDTRASRRDWIYLRLFFGENYMGWNAEEWPTYLRDSALVFVVVASIALLLRRRLFKVGLLKSLRRLVWGETKGMIASPPNRPQSLASYDTTVLILLVFWLPAFIGLYFMAGRLTVGGYSPGVREMPNYGCCAQGLLIPNRHLQMLEQEFRSQPFDLPGDSLIEQIADHNDMIKYAMIPSVLQHSGVRGSSASSALRKPTWNFSFERWYSRKYNRLVA